MEIRIWNAKHYNASFVCKPKSFDQIDWLNLFFTDIYTMSQFGTKSGNADTTLLHNTNV